MGGSARNRASERFACVYFAALMFFCAFFMPLAAALAAPLDFTTFRLGADSGAVMVVGGIQGDEPGGFSAATLLATRYEILKGSVWVVPNLNFPSIIKRCRGLHGDMNRKFARMDESDPEFATVRRIQELIRHPDVKLVLNLHDGSGYYRPERIDKLCNPSRWGQSIIIDQERLGAGAFLGDLAGVAANVASRVNSSLVKPLHAIHVHNTNTARGDKEMEKSLSYYAVLQGKAAFGLEASKEFPVATRTYYHLQMIESFLKLAGVEFRRDFELTPDGIERALGENLGVSFAGNRVFLPLDNARPAINSLPLSRACVSSAITSKPIMAVLPCGEGGGICVHYGNRMIARISPEWREMDEGLDAARALVDGREKVAPFGHVLDVEDEVIVKKIPGYRVNAIGYDAGLKDESEQPLRKKDFKPRFSLDKEGNLFRVEVYRDKSFAGMFLIRFAKGGAVAEKKESRLPGARGRESELGF